MSEADQRQTLIKLLKPLHAVSVENPTHAGTPDLNYGGRYTLQEPCTVRKDGVTHEGVRTFKVYLEGWIECKWEKEWPKRGGPLRVDHYTHQQHVWARKRRHRGGACWLILTVGRDWILLDGAVAATLPLGDATREQLIDSAVAHWETPPDREGLISCLSPQVNGFSSSVRPMD